MNTDDQLENTPETFQKLINETNEYKDKYLRAVAEAQNFKNRVTKDKENAIKFANESLARDLIETLDNFENALKVELTPETKIGIELIYNGLVSTLNKHNVFACQTDTFDPALHEAVSMVNVGLEKNQIVEVLRKGYVIGDRLLRSATVVIQQGG